MRPLIGIPLALALLTACDGGSSDGGTGGSSGGSTSAEVEASTSGGESSSSTGLDEGDTTTSGGESSSSEGGDESSSSSTGEPVVCEPPASLSVLFIGNSFTYTHDLPGMVSGLGEDASLPIETDSITQGGQRLSYHVMNEATLPLIQSQPWDYVVIQGHSLETLDDLEGFLENGETLVEWIEDAGAEPLLYETWARSPLHDIWGDPGFDYATPDEMQDAVSAGYQQLSDLTGARIVPAGQAWQVLWSSADVETVYPWGGDEYHPSVAGTYLNASVFFLALTGVSLDTVQGEQPLAPEAVDILQAVAEQVVPPCR